MKRRTFDPNNPNHEERALLARAAADLRVQRWDAEVNADGFVESMLLTRAERIAQADEDARALARRLGVRVTRRLALGLRRVVGGNDPMQLAPDAARRALADLDALLPRDEDEEDDEGGRVDAVERLDDVTNDDDPVGRARAKRDAYARDAWRTRSADRR